MYMFCPILAKFLKSSDKAFMIEYVAIMVDHSRRNEDVDFYSNGQFYTAITIDSWERLLPWLSRATVRRYLDDLRRLDFLQTARLGAAPTDATLHYTLNTPLVRSRGWSSHLGGSENIDMIKMSNSDLLKMSTPRAREYSTELAGSRVMQLTSGVATHEIHEERKINEVCKKEREDQKITSIIHHAREKGSEKSPAQTPAQIPKIPESPKQDPNPTNADTSKTNKNPPPLHQESIEVRWHRWTQKTTRAVAFRLSDITAGIWEMKTANNLSNDQLWAIFEHVQQSPFFKQRMLSPRDWSRKCGNTNNLEAIQIELEAKTKKTIGGAKKRDGKEINSMQDLIDKCF